ncbi:MAG: hypothetical protein WBH40_00815 [Ignavibacteriaceae bacterium]
MKKRIYFFCLMVGILFMIPYTTLMPQDAHYWNLQYGTRSTLLGGAVIGSVSDLSATYYNPGAVALFEDANFILSARVYQLETITVEDGAGKGKDLDYSTVVPSPSFVAFDLKFDFLGKARLALSILTRQKMNFEFQTRLIDSLDILEGSPGKENFAGGISIEREFDEVWGGITYSSKTSDMVGFGLTGYIAYRSQRASAQTIVQVLPSEGDIASYTELQGFRYNNFRFLVKGGVGLDLNPLTLGLTVTSPSVNITGTGTVSTHFFLSGVDTSGDGINDNQFQSNFQDEVNSQYKSSWAVGVGGGYRLGKFKFHASAEWYDKVDKFFVLDTEEYTAQGSGEILTNDLTHEYKSITNYGFGIDFFSNPDLIFSASFVTDFSARVPDTETNHSVSTWNIYHISGGTTFKVGRSDLTLGLEYAFGSKNIQRNIDLTDPGNTKNPDIESDAKVISSRFKILIGFVL